MDGGRRALLGDLTDGRAKHSSTPGPPHRCGWCGLLPLPEDEALSEERGLCGECLANLEDVDWRGLLNENASAVAK